MTVTLAGASARVWACRETESMVGKSPKRALSPSARGGSGPDCAWTRAGEAPSSSVSRKKRATTFPAQASYNPAFTDFISARPPQTFSCDGLSGRRSEEHTSELQSLRHLVCRLLLEKKTKYSTLYTCRLTHCGAKQGRHGDRTW